MNPFGAIVLGALLAEFAVNLAADILNLRTLRQDLPEEFAGVYDAVAYTKSHAYTRARTVFGISESAFNLIVVLLFWFLGGFQLLDEAVRSLAAGPVWGGVLYCGALFLLKGVLSLPFSVYSTFVIEERFGFNKTTPATFVADIARSLLLGVVLGGPLVAGVLAFFAYAGSAAWLFCWGASVVFLLFVQFVAPTWIMPLFNTFTPLLDGELKGAILSYADGVGFSLRDITMMDGSRRSSKSNAFFTGFGKNKRIALFDTLIQKHSVQELVAVLAHEIGHYKKKHIRQGILISVLHMGVVFFLLSLTISSRGLYDAFFLKEPSVYAGIVFFGLLFTPLEMILSVLLQAVSRKNEYEADRFAAETIERPETMADALKKLSVVNLTHLTPHPFYVFLNYSHPPVLQRIRAIRRNAGSPRAPS
jgi:STE24 endopeptidase